MKRALVYFTEFAPTIGGSEYLAFTILKALQEKYEITLALMRRREDPKAASKLYGVEIDWSRVKVIYLEPTGWLAKLDRHIGFAWRRRLRKMGPEYDCCISCANIVDFGRPGIHFIFMMNFERFFQAWAQEWHLRGWGLVRHYLVAGRDKIAFILAGARSVRRILRQGRDVVLPNSEYVRGMIERFYDCKVHPAFYPPTIFETDLKNHVDRTQIGYLGRICPEKRIRELIEIVRQARERTGKNLIFHIAGYLKDDLYCQSVRSLALRYPWVVLHGSVCGDDKKRFLASIAIALHGRKAEEFGISITEYLKAGVIPVVPNHGGAAEVVGDDSLCFGNDLSGCEILCRLVVDEKAYQWTRSRCTTRANIFSVHEYWSRQDGLLKELSVV